MAQHVAAEIQAKARAIGKTVVNQIEALGDDKEFSNTELHVHLNHELGEKCGIALQGSGTASIKTLFSDEGCAETRGRIPICRDNPFLLNLANNSLSRLHLDLLRR